MNCLFCKIIAGELPSSKLYEDGQMLVFRDVAPQAPFHALAIPKGEPHLDSAAALARHPERAGVIGHMLGVIAQHQAEWGLEGGYRLISNTGMDAFQTVPHLHFHILGGCQLPEKPR